MRKKAAYYERHIEEWGHKRLGFIHTLYWGGDENGWIREVSDNDGGYTAPYLAAMCHKYAVTGDENARKEAVDAFKAMVWLDQITPKDGFIARGLNGMQAQTYVLATYAISGVEKYQEGLKQLLEWGYHNYTVRQKITFQIDLLSLAFIAVFLIVCIPASFIIDTFSIRTGVGIGAVLNGIFGFMKGIFAVNYTMVVTAQIGLAVAQPFILNAATKVAGLWFPISEQATAVGSATLAQFLGIIAVMIFTPMMVFIGLAIINIVLSLLIQESGRMVR